MVLDGLYITHHHGVFMLTILMIVDLVNLVPHASDYVAGLQEGEDPVEWWQSPMNIITISTKTTGRRKLSYIFV